MAEVLSPLAPSNSPLSVGQQARPSTPDKYSQSQQKQAAPRIVQMPRSNYNNHSSGGMGYRGTAAAPTYAFKATPNLQGQHRPAQQQQIQHNSPPSQPLNSDSSAANRQRYPTAASVSTTSSSTASSNPSSAPSQPAVSTWSQLFSKNDSTFSSNFEVAPFTTEKGKKETSKQEPIPEASSDAFPPLTQAQALTDPSPKATPGRYRRGQKRADTSPTSAESQAPITPMGQFSHGSQPNGFTPKLTTEIPSSEMGAEDVSKDFNVSGISSTEPQVSPGAEQQSAKQGISSLSRYRRRSSVNTLDGKGQAAEKAAPASPGAERPSSPSRPPSSAKQNPRSSSPSRAGLSVRTDGSNGPAKTFAEVARRTNAPSPLSRPMTPDHGARNLHPSSPPAGPTPLQSQAFQNSPAVAAMAALSEKDNKKSGKSRLRRAFSFGGSTELDKPAREVEEAKERAQARRDQFSNELDEEQAAIARQQEAAGLGESIYSGQAGFVGSTDNLSISSTASSASMMLRKMGKGMKKGGRSIKGLFRPKSAIGVAPPDGPLGAGVGEISRVTVEAEREKVNVNIDPRDQHGGGTGFPKLERNSVDAVRASVGDERPQPSQLNGLQDTRKSIVGGDTDRAEVLASVKRSILKRSNTGSPNGSPTLRPVDSAAFTQQNSTSFERGASPVPSGNSDGQRNGQVREIASAMNGDYFSKIPKVGTQSTRSLPGTPKSTSSRNISFSPRLIFHDVWSASDYDRRGDIATCNRLTPMLAQQIKEELNTFKMEMEVHESSKPHTHFF